MAKANCQKHEKNAPLVSSTKNVLQRCIYVENYNLAEFCQKTKEIAGRTNVIIQKLMLRSNGRQLPFVSLHACKGSNECGSTRVILKGLEDDCFKKYHGAAEDEQSYLIEFQISAEYKKITFSNISCDAKLVLDEKYLDTASVDLFLDSCMFYSFSFLRNMSLVDKKRFSKEKYEYFKKNGLPCYYQYDEEDKLTYYSLAFSAHKDNGDLDLERYVLLWTDFLSTYYSDNIHKEESVEAQLTKHAYVGQLDVRGITSAFSELPDGDYLLLLTARRARGGKNAVHITSIFGDSAGHLKAWKIVPIHEYKTYSSLIQQAYISAFKIVR